MTPGDESHPTGWAWGAAARVYSGIRQRDGRTLVSVNGWPLDPCSNLRSSPVTAFDWGYEGHGGPQHLAFAILTDHFGDQRVARRHFEAFARRVIGRLPKDYWTLTGAEIKALCAEGDR
jgi:hypothetical protein